MSSGSRDRSGRWVRGAGESDGAGCAAIYAPYVHDTAVSFELEPPTADEMAARIASAVRTHAWLVLETGDGVTGYAYGGPMKSRAAYRWACEVSVYVEPSGAAAEPAACSTKRCSPGWLSAATARPWPV